MVKEIETGMAEQLERVHEWWANNEMAPLPKSLGIVPLTMSASGILRRFL